MDDKKICKHCEVEKSIEEFSLYKNRNGEKVHRNVCKTCLNKQQSTKYRADNKNKVNNTSKVIEPVKTENKLSKIEIKKIEKEREYKSMFNDSEIEILKNLISKNNDIMAILNNRINFEKIEDNKVKKSITISAMTHNKILELTKNNDLNYSQIVDSLLKKALENM